MRSPKRYLKRMSRCIVTSLAASLALLTVAAAPAAGSKRSDCVNACSSAIIDCMARTARYGDFFKACDRTLRKRCKKEGVSACDIGRCGDVVAQNDEQCDFLDLHDATCLSLGYGGGDLRCTDACTLNLTGCVPPTPTGLLVTGQHDCYGDDGGLLPCDGTGQDGELQFGLPQRYNDHQDTGEGIIDDLQTGLTWEKLNDDGSIHDLDNLYTWQEAIAVKIAALNAAAFAGFSDWRLPNVRELDSLVTHGEPTSAIASPEFQLACLPGCTFEAQHCSCTADGPYWTSTTVLANRLNAWTIDFEYGLAGWGAKQLSLSVRAVRGGVRP